jgi:hypothetical protein
MNDLPAIWNAITPTTLTTTFVVGVMFAAYLWHAFPRVTSALIATVWLAALTFIICCGVARWADSSPTWETYIGSSVLWTWYCAVTATTVWTWRRVRRKGC